MSGRSGGFRVGAAGVPKEIRVANRDFRHSLKSARLAARLVQEKLRKPMANVASMPRGGCQLWRR